MRAKSGVTLGVLKLAGICGSKTELVSPQIILPHAGNKLI